MKALVLSGGGSKGAYQVGVWKALRKLNYKFDIVTGTSIGALNGAMIVQNDYKKLLKIWKKINLSIFLTEDNIEPDNDIEIYKTYGKHILTNGGIEIKQLEKIIKKGLNINKFYNSKINYGLITYNLTTKQPLELEKNKIDKTELLDYLMASATCFPAFQTKIIEGEEHIDGGYYDNLPINQAISMGATEIIAIDLKAPGLKKTPKKKVKTIYIKPKNKLSSFLNFSKETTLDNIKFGYNDTMKTFNIYEGNKYTFKKQQLEKNKKLYKETYFHILNKILKYKTTIKHFEKLLKIDISIDNDKKETIINNLLLKIIESLGTSFELDETKVYTHRKFNKLLKLKLKYYLKMNNNKKEIHLYQLLKNEDYIELRKQILIYPYETLKAIYLYTICEA